VRAAPRRGGASFAGRAARRAGRVRSAGAGEVRALWDDAPRQKRQRIIEQPGIVNVSG
jgi:hypothetical protein